MKRSILYTTVALAAFASGYVGSSSLVSVVSTVQRVAVGGEKCVTEQGFSGYMVSGGLTGSDYCQADGQS